MTKVLYIGGTGRTGSTLLDRVLGQFDGWFSGGELAFFWRYGIDASGKCSCGVTVASCPTWTAILDVAFGGLDRVDSGRMIALRRRFWSVHLPMMVTDGIRRRMLDRLEEFPEVVERLYEAIATSTKSSVVIDSSKEPHYSYILRERTDLDIYFLHLVRDPRAVGYSWQRRRSETGLGGATDMEVRAPWRASAYFDVSNIAGEALWSGDPERYRVLRYEDLLADPSATLEAIGEFVGEPLDASTVLQDSSFENTELHSAWGNPNRFDRGRSEIRPDDTWRTELSGLDAWKLSALTGPVSARFGYPISPRGALSARLPSRLSHHRLATGSDSSHTASGPSSARAASKTNATQAGTRP